MKLKKKILSLATGLLLCSNIASAQVVTVDGVGMSREEATRDALRVAVEQVVGMFVDSRTLVRDSMTELDEIYVNSQGFVTKFDVLSEQATTAGVRVSVRVDVNSNPNSALLNKLNMLMMLNNPRIGAVIQINNEYSGLEDELKSRCESHFNNKLLDMGFKHVVDSNVAEAQISGGNSSLVDYLVSGKLSMNYTEIEIPKFVIAGREEEANTPVQTGLKTAVATLSAKIIKSSTNEVIGQFVISGRKIHANEAVAKTTATEQVAQLAAEKVASIFSKKASAVVGSGQFVVYSDSFERIKKFADHVKGLPGVQGVQLRNYTDGKSVIDVDSSQNIESIFFMIQERGKFTPYVENCNDNVYEIRI